MQGLGICTLRHRLSDCDTKVSMCQNLNQRLKSWTSVKGCVVVVGDA